MTQVAEYKLHSATYMYLTTLQKVEHFQIFVQVAVQFSVAKQVVKSGITQAFSSTALCCKLQKYCQTGSMQLCLRENMPLKWQLSNFWEKV